MLRILEKVNSELETVTEEERRATRLSLNEPVDGEELLGNLHDMDAINLFSLARRYGMLSAKEMVRAKFEADNAVDKEESTLRALEHDATSDTLMDMFWWMVKEQIGCWQKKNVGVRSNFMVVEVKAQAPSMPAFFRGMVDG